MDTLVSPDPKALGSILKSGGLVIFPTETVYGIGASSENEEACLRIYQLKNRPSDNPLICHYDSIERIEFHCVLSPLGRKLLETFSPGPLTLVLRKKNRNLFPKELNTVAVRIPKPEVVRNMIQYAGGVVSAPSANLSGRPSLTRLEDIKFYFLGKVDGILVAPDPEIGIESTVLDLTSDDPVFLRPGTIEFGDLQTLIPNLRRIPSLAEREKNEVSPLSPGLKYKHYSPKAKIILCSREEFVAKVQGNDSEVISGKKWGAIGFSILENSVSSSKGIRFVDSYAEYTKELYAFFESCDKMELDLIFCEVPIEERGTEGLRNRLFKAAEKLS